MHNPGSKTHGQNHQNFERFHEMRKKHLWIYPALADLRGGHAGRTPPPTGPNSFIFTYIFTEKCPHWGSTPPLTGPRPPMGNPGSATTLTGFLLPKEAFLHGIFASYKPTDIFHNLQESHTFLFKWLRVRNFGSSTTSVQCGVTKHLVNFLLQSWFPPESEAWEPCCSKWVLLCSWFYFQ